MNAAVVGWRASRLRHQARSLWRAWGWPGAAGVVCLALAAWAQLVHVPLLRDELSTTQQAVARAERSAVARRAAARVGIAESPALRFRAAFPAAGERHERLAALVALAGVHGIRPARIDLRWVPGVPLARYQITMPVEAPYPVLRGFLSAALASDPSLSLDAVRFRRRTVAADAIEAELRWSLNLRDDDAVAATDRGVAMATPSAPGRSP